MLLHPRRRFSRGYGRREITQNEALEQPRRALDALRAAIGADLPAYLADLERLVDIDCGSYTPAGVDAVGR